MEDCIFCKIIEGTIPSAKVFENDDVVAFKDLNPVAPVHVLIVPKNHFSDLYEMSSTPQGLEILTRLYRAFPEIVRACGLESAGFRLINNCGEDAGQTVMHVHFHLIGGLELGPRII
ncbi:MAG TPA: histidine triad nucleotide-binding protein [Bacillota bacterium]|jgi:histidine triad (HIT) family protein|nr:histidine triad nucleotide-binding protein [Fastidiosipila sp.]HPX93759.1 histidine triad nucleotide-binding protein [Bacillota bacterium]HQB81569.1 histidine triad nucleotide-binding protein [Bacillota bacterium]